MINYPEIITLIVCPSKVKRTYHKAFLVFFSEYYDVLCYGAFAEASQETLQLPDEDVENLNIFTSWIYTSQILGASGLVGLWVLGDRLRSPGFANEIMHTLFGKYVNCGGQYMTAHDAIFIYDNTHQNSKLREFTKQLLMLDGLLCGYSLKLAGDR
jgi:BTB/POZ domain